MWFGVPFLDSRIVDKTKYNLITRVEVSRVKDTVVDPILEWIDARVSPTMGPIEGLCVSSAMLLCYVYLFWFIDPSFTGMFGWIACTTTGSVILAYYMMISLTHKRLHEKPFYHVAFVVVEILGIIHLSVLIASVTRLGRWVALFSFITSFTAMYATVWESTITGRIEYKAPFLPTDIHILASLACAVSAVVPDSRGIIGFLVVSILTGSAVYQTFKSVRVHIRDPKLKDRIVKEWVSWACVVGGCLIWIGSSTDAYNRHPHPFLISEVLIGVYVLARMVLDATYQKEVQYFHWVTLLPMLVGLLDAAGLPDSITLAYVVYTIVLLHFFATVEIVRRDIYI